MLFQHLPLYLQKETVKLEQGLKALYDQRWRVLGVREYRGKIECVIQREQGSDWDVELVIRGVCSLQGFQAQVSWSKLKGGVLFKSVSGEDIYTLDACLDLFKRKVQELKQGKFIRH